MMSKAKLCKVVRVDGLAQEEFSNSDELSEEFHYRQRLKDTVVDDCETKRRVKEKSTI